MTDRKQLATEATNQILSRMSRSILQFRSLGQDDLADALSIAKHEYFVRVAKLIDELPPAYDIRSACADKADGAAAWVLDTITTLARIRAADVLMNARLQALLAEPEPQDGQ